MLPAPQPTYAHSTTKRMYMYIVYSLYMLHVHGVYITQYGSTVYIGIAMVFVFPPYIREIQILLLVSSQFDF